MKLGLSSAYKFDIYLGFFHGKCSTTHKTSSKCFAVLGWILIVLSTNTSITCAITSILVAGKVLDCECLWSCPSNSRFNAQGIVAHDNTQIS